MQYVCMNTALDITLALRRNGIEIPKIRKAGERTSDHFHTLEEALMMAKELEKRYGEVPAPAKLCKTGFNWLVQFMRVYPESFASIKREPAYDPNTVWHSHYHSFMSYVSGNGRFPRKRGGDDEETFLGLWGSTQRAVKKAGELPAERVKLLEAVPGWKWDFKSDVWSEGYESVKAFAENNNKTPSAKSKNKEEARLGEWCQTQKKAKRKGNLSPERIKLLEAIPGFRWNFQQESFQERYDALKSLASEDMYVRSSLRKKNKQLAVWCYEQKKSYNHGELPPEKIKLFESLPGWTWDTDEANWRHIFNRVKDFLDKNKKFPTHGGKDREADKLAGWCSYQREHKNTRLSPEKIKLLETLPGWCWEFKNVWSEHYDKIMAFANQHGRVPMFREDGFKWCASQRDIKNNGYKMQPKRELSLKRIKLLEAIPGWYWTQESRGFPSEKSNNG